MGCCGPLAASSRCGVGNSLHSTLVLTLLLGPAVLTGACGCVLFCCQVLDKLVAGSLSLVCTLQVMVSSSLASVTFSNSGTSCQYGSLISLAPVGCAASVLFACRCALASGASCCGALIVVHCWYTR